RGHAWGQGGRVPRRGSGGRFGRRGAIGRALGHDRHVARIEPRTTGGQFQAKHLGTFAVVEYLVARHPGADPDTIRHPGLLAIATAWSRGTCASHRTRGDVRRDPRAAAAPPRETVWASYDEDGASLPSPRRGSSPPPSGGQVVTRFSCITTRAGTRDEPRPRGVGSVRRQSCPVATGHGAVIAIAGSGRATIRARGWSS